MGKASAHTAGGRQGEWWPCCAAVAGGLWLTLEFSIGSHSCHALSTDG